MADRLITKPVEPLRPVIDSPDALATAVADLRNAHGPVAIDTERASSYRYSARAYLVQLRREGAGTFLIDPLGAGDLSELNQVIATVPWIAHDAAQDLPCLADAGLAPYSLFDTEVACRLLGDERYGLAAACSHYLGVELAKEYSRADWSTRPLPQAWLTYAALDVEFLIPLYRVLAQRLVASGKDNWAVAEFEAIRTQAPPEPPAEPWRELKGAGRLRSRRALALLQRLYQLRDDIGRELDIAPTHLVSNRDLITLAEAEPSNRRQISRFSFMRKPEVRPYLKDFAFAAVGVKESDPDSYPRRIKSQKARRSTAGWATTQPDAHAHLQVIRAITAQIAKHQNVDPQLLFAASLRRELALQLSELSDSGQQGLDPEKVRPAIMQLPLRQWQAQLITAPLVQALSGAQHH